MRKNKFNLLSRNADWMLEDRPEPIERDATINLILVLMLASAGFTAYFAACLWYLPK
jgi:hypothetical protein